MEQEVIQIIKSTTTLFQDTHEILNVSYENNFNIGDTLIVTWDNIKYTCKAAGVNSMCAFIGNNSLHDGNECGPRTDTGEPFFIIRLHPNTFVIAKEVGTHTIAIDKAIIEVENKYNDNLPIDFPRFSFKGESASKADFLVTPYTGNFSTGYIFILDYKGNIKWYKHFPSFCYNFKQHKNKNNDIRYSYMVTEEATNGQYDLCYGVLMNDKMEVIKDNIRLLECGTIKNEHPLECHTFTFLDDGHYIMTAINQIAVNNIPGIKETVYVTNNIIQEQKDGEVIWHFEVIDYPELYQASVWNNNFKDGTVKYNATDHAHINAVTRDDDGNILASFRNLGLVKINYQTKEIMWTMGRGHNDIAGLTEEELPYLQHDVRYMEDGSFTIFDNYGCPEDRSRICRYWIDDETKTVKKVELLNANYPRSLALGYSEQVKNENNVYDITYGVCNGSPALEEYDFNNNKSNMTLSFNDGYLLYNISRAIHNYNGQVN